MGNWKIYVRLIWIVILVLALSIGSLLYSTRNKNVDGQSQKIIGAVFMTMNNPYFEVLSEGLKTVVDSHGDMYMEKDSAMNAESQLQQIKELIQYGVDCLVVNPVDWQEIKPGLEYAKKKGVPVICLDAAVFDENMVECSIYSDNIYCGQLIATHLMKQRDSAHLLLLTQSSNKSARDRIEGFLNTLDSNHWPYEIVDTIECEGQLEITEPLVTDLLKTRQDIDAVVALNDPSALGAMAALDAIHKLDGVLVYGVDGAPEAKTLISEGRMTATVAQSPVVTSKFTAKYIYDILAGKRVPKKRIISVDMISKDNIEKYSLTGWQ